MNDGDKGCLNDHSGVIISGTEITFMNLCDLSYSTNLSKFVNFL